MQLNNLKMTHVLFLLSIPTELQSQKIKVLKKDMFYCGENHLVHNKNILENNLIKFLMNLMRSRFVEITVFHKTYLK